MNKKEIIGICEFLRVHHFENSYKLLDYYNKCNKQKEVLDKIKEYIEHENFKRNILLGISEKKYTRDILNHILEMIEEIK